MNQFTKSTGNRLEGYNSPRCDKVTKRTPIDPALLNKPRVQKSRSYRASCIETLIKYRAYVSHNDVALHHRYREMMNAVKLAPLEWTQTMNDGDKRRYYLYHYASVFRECIYHEFYNRAEKAINSFKRGDSWYWTEDQSLYMMITPDTFMLQISLKRATDQGVF